MRRLLRAVSALFLLAVGAMWVGALLSGPAQEVAPGAASPRTGGPDDLTAALIRCENATRDALADPSGFDPQPHADWQLIPDGEDPGLHLRFDARARNGFGALVWARFDCRVRHDGTRWRAEIRQVQDGN